MVGPNTNPVGPAAAERGQPALQAEQRMPASRSVSSRRSALVAALAALVLLATFASPAPAAPKKGGGPPFEIQILSSAPDQVSGGDALVRVALPGTGLPTNAVLLLNGANVTGSLSPAPGGGALVGVVQGFALGDNLLQLKLSPSAKGVLAQLVVVNHPLSGPIFSGPQQQPFVCTTARSGLGQPIIDHQAGIGIRVP